MAFSNNSTLTASDLNNLSDITAVETMTGVKSFNAAGNPKINVAADLVEQSSAPATPAAGNARLYVDNGNPPILKLKQDDGDVHVVGGWQYDETRRMWILYDRDLTTWVRHWSEIELVDDWFQVETNATTNFYYTNSGSYGVVETGASTFPNLTTRGGGARISTAAAVNDRCALLWGQAVASAGHLVRGDQAQFYCLINTIETTAKMIQFGMASDPAATLNPGADGIYWEYDSGAQADWVGVVRTGAANTDLASTVNADGITIHLLFIVDGGVNVKFYTRTAYTSTWTLAGTNTGSQPGAATRLIPFIRVETLAAATKSLDIYHTEIRARDGV